MGQQLECLMEGWHIQTRCGRIHEKPFCNTHPDSATKATVTLHTEDRAFKTRQIRAQIVFNKTLKVEMTRIN